MNPVLRTKNLMTLLGWQGGTVHDACKKIGLDAHDFLYADADFDYGCFDYEPCFDFKRGYLESGDIEIRIKQNAGNLQYWLGAISAIQKVTND